LQRELVKQQQQNLLLQKQMEIDRLEAQADRTLLSQAHVSSGKQAPRGKLAQVPEEGETSSPETATVELTDSDSPPPPSQNRPKPAVVNVSVQEPPVSVSELAISTVVARVVSPALGVATGVPLPGSEGPLVIPRGLIVDTKAVPIASVVTLAGAPPTLQEPAGGGIGQSSATIVPVAVPPVPTVVVKQPEPVRPYRGTTSYKVYKEYFERICVCNDCETPTKCARHLLVAMDGAASERSMD